MKEQRDQVRESALLIEIRQKAGQKLPRCAPQRPRIRDQQAQPSL